MRDACGNRLVGDGARDERGEPCLWVHGPAWIEAPPSNWFKAAFPKAAAVYPHDGQLWLTAKALQAGRMRMPDDARGWIESVFGEAAITPVELGANANRAEGESWAARSQGGANVVKLTSGYARGDVIDWWSEAKTPSRLGEASTTVLLARWEGERLRPWIEHDKESAAWAYSSARVPARLIARRAEGSTPEREAALQAVEAGLPGMGKWSVLLPLKVDGQSWLGSAFALETKGVERRMLFRYSALGGLVAVEESGGEPPD